MKNIKGTLLHESDNWKTPKELFNELMKRNYIDTFKYNSNEDELKNNYINKKLFINPPFSKMKEVSKWVIKQLKNRNKIILLIPARTDTQYFHDLLKTNPLIYMFKGRFHYNESKLSAPFPTIALMWDTRPLISYNIFPWYDYGTIEQFLKMEKKNK